MKKILVVVLALIMIFSISACGSSSGGEDSGEDGNFTVGISLAWATCNPYIVQLTDSVVAACEAKGWTVNLQDADADASKQSTQIDNLITQEVDLLIVWPHDSEAAIADTKKAYDAGIPVVAFFVDVAEEAYQYVNAYVGASQLDIAADVAKYMDQLLGGEGNIVIINGTEGNIDFMMRSQGFQETVAELGDYKILCEEFCNSDRTIGQTKMENCLTAYDDIDAVFAPSDDFAIGVFNALKAEGVNHDIPLFSIDGMAEAVTLLADGEWEGCTVWMTTDMFGEKVADVAEQILNGTFSGDYNQYVDYYLVTNDNASEYAALLK